MSCEFSINTKNILESAKNFGKMSKEIQTLAKRVEDCDKNLASLKGGFSVLRQYMGNIYEDMLNEAAELETFQEALESIVLAYLQCEKKICAGSQNMQVDKSQTSTESTDKRGLWEKFIDFIFGRERDPSYIATTDEQQQAADEEMQQQLQKILEEDKYSEDAWKNATFEERKTLLEDYMKEVESVLGIDVKDEINYFYEPAEDGIITNGYYTDSKDRVSINAYIIDTYDPEDSYFLFTIITHEMRHAYQHAAVDNPTDYQVSQETIDMWEENFDNYISSDEGFDDYRNQPVEADARQFAGQK